MVVALTPSAADPPTAITVFATGVPSAPVATPRSGYLPAGTGGVMLCGMPSQALRRSKPGSRGHCVTVHLEAVTI
jgi:hypothetical protein